MNFKRNEKYASVAFYAFLTISAAALVVVGLFNFGAVTGFIKKVFAVMSPFVYGFIIAYVTDPIVGFFSEKVFTFKKAKKNRFRLRRGLSVFCALLTLLLLLSVLVYSVLPQIAKSYEDLGGQLNTYIENIQNFADNIVREHSDTFFGTRFETLAELLREYDITFSFKELLTKSYSFMQVGLNYVLDYGTRFVGGVKDFVMGFILSIYFLLSKEKLIANIKKVLYAVSSPRAYLNSVRLARFTHKTFGGFIVGKLLDSLIVGLLTFAVLWICRIPYYPLVAVIVGITNIIPFFGPFIGAIPSAFIIFIASPVKALWFILIIIVIQQLDGNIIGPRILGDSIGIDSLLVVTAITVAGGFFGFAGLLLGVPAAAVIYVLFKQHIEKKLRHKKAPVSSAFYSQYPPKENIIDPTLVLIDRDTPVPEPRAGEENKTETENDSNENTVAFDKVKP